MRASAIIQNTGTKLSATQFSLSDTDLNDNVVYGTK